MRAMVNARTSRVLVLISFLAPLTLLVWFVGHYGVNVPHLDDWRMVEFIAKTKAHELSFRDLCTQFNEHRILLPKVIFAIGVMKADWNLKLLMFCSVAVAAMTCLLLLRLSTISRPIGEPPGASLCYKLVVCLFVFSWAQFENWLWGFQVAWLLVNLGVVGAVTLLSSEGRLSLLFRVGLAALCCLAASFSMAHGLLSWMAVGPSLAALRVERRRKGAVIAAWIVMAASTWLIYMTGYERPHGWSYTAPLLHEVKHLLMLLGGSFFIGRFTVITYAAGLFMIAGVAGSIVYLMSRWGTDVFCKGAPWISLSLFALLFAAVNTVGRTNFGERTATASRYATCMVLLYISLIHLWRLFRRERFLSKLVVRTGDLWFVGMILVFFVVSTHQVIRAHELLLRGSADRACVEVSDQFDHRIDRHSDSCFRSFGPGEGEEFWRRVADAQALLGIKEAPRFEPETAMPGEVNSALRGGDVTVSGWVEASGTAEPTVFLSSEEGRLVASAQPEFDWNAGTIIGWSRPQRQNWRAVVAGLSDPGKIEAWAYDRRRHVLVRIQ
jgi:hypothetical protein